MIDVDETTGLWTLTLRRPDKANALTRSMLNDLLEAVGRGHALPVRRPWS